MARASAGLDGRGVVFGVDDRRIRNAESVRDSPRYLVVCVGHKGRRVEQDAVRTVYEIDARHAGQMIGLGDGQPFVDKLRERRAVALHELAGIVRILLRDTPDLEVIARVLVMEPL